MAIRTRFTELVGCRVPVQQAGLGGGIGTPALAAAVADAGALGMLGMILPPMDLAGTLDRLRDATSGPVGVNFLVPFTDPAAVDVAASRVRVVDFFFGDPAPDLVERAHRGGALASWQVGSAAEARAAVDAGCDFVIAQGTEAGGHVRGRTGLLPLLVEVLDAVGVPVLAAGGIGTGRAVAAALAAGADGVRIGTRFVAAAESGAHPDYVARLVAAGAEDTVLTEAFSADWPAPHRVLRSAVDAADALGGDVAGEVRIDAENSIPVVRHSSLPPTRDTVGEIGAMALYAGESVDAVRGTRPAGEIVRELVDEAERLLAALSSAAARGEPLRGP